MCETVQTVSVGNDTFAFDIVENLADLLRRELVVIQEWDETSDGPLEVDVVLPERVVSVDEESLGGQASSSRDLEMQKEEVGGEELSIPASEFLLSVF